MSSLFFRIILLCAIAALTVFSPQVHANEHDDTQLVRLSEDGKTIYLIGRFVEGAYFKFAKALRAAPKAETIFLASEGGMVTQGFLIGNLIRKHGLNTYVGHYCASACTLAFVAGKQRGVSENARLGFHQSYLVGPNGETIPDPDGISFARKRLQPGQAKLRPAANSILGLTGNERIALLFGRAGISGKFTEKVLAIQPENMWEPERGELTEAHVTNSVMPAIDLPPGLSTSQQSVAALMRSNPFWAAMKQANAKEFARITQDIWRKANGGADARQLLDTQKDKQTGILENEFSQLPDDLLAPLMTVYANLGAYHRQTNYQLCERTATLAEARMDPAFAMLTKQVDAVIGSLLIDSRRQEPMPVQDARKIINKQAKRLNKTGLMDPKHDVSEYADCKSGFQVFEAIAAIKPKYRLKTFRAITSVGTDQ